MTGADALDWARQWPLARLIDKGSLVKLKDMRWTVGLLAGAVVVAAMGLSGCDQKKSADAESTPAAVAKNTDPAGDSIGPFPAAAPASTAVAPASPPAAAPSPAPVTTVSGNEIRRVYVFREGDAELKTLVTKIGKYPQDGNYLQQGVLADRLRALLDSRYSMVLKNLQTVSPLTKEGDVWTIVGNRQHQGGTDAAAVVIDPVRNGLRVWLMRNGKQTSYTDLAQETIDWPPSVSKTMANAAPAAASARK